LQQEKGLAKVKGRTGRRGRGKTRWEGKYFPSQCVWNLKDRKKQKNYNAT
jgi:hypothetical protein